MKPPALLIGPIIVGLTLLSGHASTNPGLASTYTAAAAGGRHTCALLTTGTVKCWGRNAEGEVGDGTFVEQTSPRAGAMPRPT
jgi:hypothetical protein